MVDDLMRGLVMSPMEAMDNKVTDEVANHLFEERGKPKSGMDLVSLNLQRAREHGIPCYNKYRYGSISNTHRDIFIKGGRDWFYIILFIYHIPHNKDLFEEYIHRLKLSFI